MRARDIQIEAPHIVARTAWTTDELSDAMDADRPQGRYDLVALLIGVNDQYRSRPVRSFADGFQVLLKRAIGFAGRRPSHVIAISIPDWGATPFAEGRDRALIAREVEAYNARGETLATAAGVRWVDITGITRRMQSEPALVVSDGLHPSSAMYGLWAEVLLPHATAALSRSRSKKSR